MSRPGYWRSAGRDIAYSDMTEPHLKNSMRMMARKYNELAPVAGEDTFLANCNAQRRTYYEDKLIELGEEAQRRNIIRAGDVGFEELLATVIIWPSFRDEATIVDARPTTQPLVRWHGNSLENFTMVKDNPSVIANLPPKRLGVYLNVIQEVEEIVGLPVRGLREEEDNTQYRRIDLTL